MGTVLDGLEAVLRAIPYLQKLRILINDGDTADANGVPGHSLAVCVSGGAAPEIARAIFEKKAPGIGTWGTTSETVTDENGESHQIFFSRAGTEMIYPKITLAAKTGFDQAAVTALLRDAVYSYISAMEIGAPMNVPYLYKVCYDAAGTMSDTFAIRSIRVTTTGSSGATYTETVSIAWNKRFMCLKNMIEVEVAS